MSQYQTYEVTLRIGTMRRVAKAGVKEWVAGRLKAAAFSENGEPVGDIDMVKVLYVAPILPGNGDIKNEEGEVADNADDLKADLADREAEIRGLRDDVADLIAALRPFAEAAAFYDDAKYPDTASPDSMGADDVRLSDLRTARDVLAEATPQGPHNMKLEERVEAAAKWMYENSRYAAGAWADVEPDVASTWLEEARDIIYAAFGDVFPSGEANPTPTHWIAPWEATERMASFGESAASVAIGKATTDEAIYDVFRAFRDSHLSQEGKGE